MATRRPRVKVAANLSIRRPTKTNLASNVTGETIKQEAHVTPAEPVKEHAPKDGVVASDAIATTPAEDAPMSEPPDVKAAPVAVSVPETPREETFQEFKLPKPVEQSNPQTAPPCLPGYDAISSLAISSEGEPMSPRRQDTRPTFTLPLARKRNRTESLTSNKSLPEGVTVNKVTRKVATKQEESQRTLDNKKEIRKRLTNIENVDKQNLTMFDMIYYNPVNNPMTPPALSKRGSLENLPKSVDGREGRSRSVSKSRSPTPAPSSSGPPPAVAPKTAAAPVSLTPQLKLGPNGEMILDEASLVIENEREKEMRETLANADIVFQDEFSGNSGYYSRIRRTKDWGDEETIRFYRCLHTIGTDFSMMLTLFPQRSRRDLKLKFKKEERINLNLVNKALCHPNEFNVDDLRQQFAEEDEQLEKQRQEEQQRKQEALEQQQKEQLRKKLMMKITASNNPQRKISKSERVLTDGSEVIGEEIKQPKPRKSQARKRTAVKADPGPVSENASIENEQLQQSLEPVSNANTMAVEHTSRTNPVNNEPAENAPKEESSKKRQRASTGSRKQAAAATEGTKGEQAAMLPEQYSTVVANCSENLATVNGAVEQPAHSSVVAQQQKQQEQQDDDSITVITLQNLDDQTHTTCAPSVQPTLISELTPVEIKYDEYDPEGQLVLALDDADSIVKKELHNATLGGARSEPVNVHVINWPPEAGTAPTEAIPYVLYGKLESYGCSSNTFVIPDEMVQSQGQYAMVTPTTIVNVAPPIEQPNAGTSTPAAASTYRNVDIVAQSAEAVKPAATVTSCCYETIDVTPKHELPVHHLPENNLHHTAETIANGGETNAVVKSAAPEVPSEPEPCKVDPVDDNPPSGNDKVEEVEEQQEHEEGEEEEDGDGGFSLEDIDINSLVLVESQDSVDPNKTFYEIYVSNPDTGQLSEKPLDVPADVIESIRQILEGGATGGER
uniref:Transcription factor TFIIIB component B'' Myb domain-containing protein n=1 Tax=Anopheles epiroticus TaxID=199890 RepID=A0A182PJG3_9DIPT